MTKARRTLTDELLTDAIRDGEGYENNGRPWFFASDLTMAALLELQSLRAFKRRIEDAMNGSAEVHGYRA